MTIAYALTRTKTNGKREYLSTATYYGRTTFSGNLKIHHGKRGLVKVLLALKTLPDTQSFKIFKITGFEDGLDNVNYQELQVNDLQNEVVEFGPKTHDNPRAVYKVTSADGQLLGRRKSKQYGRQWDTAGSLRTYLNGLTRYNNNALFNGIVHEIVMAPNGYDIQNVKHTPVREFYNRSPNVKKIL